MKPTQAEIIKSIPDEIHMKAYEAYRNCCGEQAALVEGGCRGGFGTAELIAFLYVATLPPNVQADEFWRIIKDIERKNPR